MLLQQDFDFDLMTKLAKEFPMEFDRKRQELLRLAIESCDRPDQAHRIQSVIDSRRAAILQTQVAAAPDTKEVWPLIGQLATLFVHVISESRKPPCLVAN